MYFVTPSRTEAPPAMNFEHDWSARTNGRLSTVNIRQWHRYDGTQYWTVSYRHNNVLCFIRERNFMGGPIDYPTMLQAMRDANRELAWAVVG